MTTEQKVQELESTVAALANRVGVLEDESAIRRLQYTYGYLIDKCLYDEAVDLFAENGEVRFMGGIYKTKPGVRRLYVGRFRKNFTNDYNGPVYGFLLDHPQMQMVIDVAPGGKTAKVRGRSMMQAGRHESIVEAGTLPRQWWEGGIYENEYVKEDGVWKIKVAGLQSALARQFRQGLGAHAAQCLSLREQDLSGRPARSRHHRAGAASSAVARDAGRAVPLFPSRDGKADGGAAARAVAREIGPNAVDGSAILRYGAADMSDSVRTGVHFPAQPMVTFGGGGSVGGAVNRAEMDLFDCEVEGRSARRSRRRVLSRRPRSAVSETAAICP